MRARRLAALLAVVALAACTTKSTDKTFFDEVGALSKEEIMARGNELLEKKHYEDARRFFSFLADSFPNDPLGRQAALKVADSFFAQRDLESLTEAQLRYKDFSNRFPNDPSRAYALLQLGKCSFNQRRGPMRDLTQTHEADESFRQVITLFPGSDSAKEAEELLARCEEDLATHEILVAKYYASVGAWEGAAQRVDYALAKYPKTKAVEEASSLIEQVRAYRTHFPASPEAAPTATPAQP
jgi:outer membrane protein assembly factor BamD